MTYSKNAFNCHKCPKKAGDGGCPMWWETVQTNIQSGETKVVKDCGYVQLPFYLIEVVKSANGMAASAESARNVMESRIGKITEMIATRAMLPAPPRGNQG